MFKRQTFLQWQFTGLYEIPYPEYTVLVKGDSHARETKGLLWPLWHYINLHSERWGWQRVAIFHPYRNGKPYDGTYYVGFRAEHIAMQCTKPACGEIGLLIGPGEVEFFARDEKGHPLEADVERFEERRNLSVPLY